MLMIMTGAFIVLPEVRTISGEFKSAVCFNEEMFKAVV